MTKKTRKIKKVLIANRGEIALRIMRTVQEMSLDVVVIYEQADSDAYYVRQANEAVMIGEGPRKDYLDIDRIIWAAKKTGADAIHPGYGFLAENPDFSAACEKAGIIFIGPPPQVIRDLGNKVVARNIMEKAGIPFIPGTADIIKGGDGINEAFAFARTCGYPVMLKASCGGGGRGIRKVKDEADLMVQLPLARSESLSAFKDDSIYMEKCIECPRHVEIQILADRHGNIIHLGSRDCSIQRRHQKLLEIAPADLPKDVLEKMYDCAVKAAREAGYINAGTVEFLVDARTNEFWFMEMNTRLQVEHTVTEELTGIDIVREQIRIAEGGVLDIPRERIHLHGKAVQVRINAEDPKNNFMPEGGKRVEVYQSPGGPGVRLDGAVYQGYRIPTDYDSLLVKMTVRGYNWEQTLQRLKRSLRGFIIVGPKTTIPFYLAICDEKDFQAGKFDTGYIDSHPEIFDYPEAEREIAKLGKLIAEIHARKINRHAY
ncbi:MAG TPA: biotin carboxylase N-terminal domain-containing protein [Syntrophales bacterium]|jgi:acetyl-CoA carboxylase biotin carboxylase subunit|nr:biotin carboxylase N-terminal domain-containing protein [Syntrophales bacterium]HON23353.1 biotin carboxylase N-terminal domain-containing protein [Syntrophales bacterium]HOU77119.1 biotin carboxylase N-terminal domain-containing protein [Syntrophales bacterium]HPC32799.1 biotin carboxylase N-terminal domain-containing protein [Syntrophales bacterium]HQG33647.1 biotin carboxylase N-terminal domain-containing protein [Syntrophales bacterium]